MIKMKPMPIAPSVGKLKPTSGSSGIGVGVAVTPGGKGAGVEVGVAVGPPGVGVAVGVAVGPGQTQSVSSGQLALRQRSVPLIVWQTKLPEQSLSLSQISQQPGGGVGMGVAVLVGVGVELGVGLGVGVLVGVGVEVGVLVGVGVAVGPSISNSRAHAMTGVGMGHSQVLLVGQPGL